jgi:hypothetical protein
MRRGGAARHSGVDRPALQQMAEWAGVIGLPLAIVGFVGPEESAAGWVGPAVLAMSSYGFLLLLFRGGPVPRFAAVWLMSAGVLVAQFLARSGLTWRAGSVRWALGMAIPVVAAILLGSQLARDFLGRRRSRWTVLGWLLTWCILVPIVFTGVVSAGEVLSHRLSEAVTNGPPPVAPDEPAVQPPTAPDLPRFPPAHSTCVAVLTKDTPPPNGVKDAVWTKVLLIAVTTSEWGPCWVGIVDFGSDGMVAVKLVTKKGGPEAAILVREAHERSDGIFVKPQAGQLYYQQPGGEPLIHWGFPDEDISCGRGRLVIFRRLDGSISGFSQWSKPIDITTRGTLSAYYTPDDIGSALVTRLERVNKRLPTAVGSVVDEGRVRRQHFYGGFSVTSTDEAIGALTADRLKARCAA